jgi:3-hydroxyisobutyrate dehydrogenase-like beta-hydroxyacid dehydrogenase
MTISVLGTGLMGTAMGQALLNAGISLVVYNRTKERTQTLVDAGAKAASTAAEAISASDISIFVMINGKAVLETLSTVPAEAIKGKIIISAASATIEEGNRMREIVEAAGGQFADMSIEIGADVLSASQGVVSLGASEATFATIQPELSKFCAEVKRLGEAGDARKLESIAVVGSMLAGVNVAYMTAFAQKVGIAPEVYEPYIAMYEPSASYVIDKMTAHNYDEILASIENYVQGLITSIENAESLNIPTGVLKESLEIYKKAVSMGYAGKDGTAVIEALLK